MFTALRRTGLNVHEVCLQCACSLFGTYTSLVKLIFEVIAIFENEANVCLKCARNMPAIRFQLVCVTTLLTPQKCIVIYKKNTLAQPVK